MNNAMFERYEAYKDSGIERLGDVPVHWDVIRVKDTVMKIGNGVTPKGGSQIYTETGIPFLRSQNVYDDGLRIANVSFISKEIHNCMKGSQLKAGDILINITGASIGRTCVVPAKLGIANINQHIAFLRPKFWFNVGYISIFIKSPFTKNYIQFEQNGASKEAFNLNQIANIPLLLPKPAEQQAIVTYLDTKTAQIDRKIDLLNQKATQYGKLKQSIINETVTRGLDKTVAMNDSGIEWIGEIPAHWEIKRIKDTTYVKGRIGWQGLRNEDFLATGDYFCVTGTDLRNGAIDWTNCYFVDQNRFYQDPYIQLRINDILITKDGTIGKVAVVENLPLPATLNSGVFVTRPIKFFYLTNFIYWIYNSSQFTAYIDLTKGGSTIQHLYQNVFNRFIFTLPSLPEQTAIAAYLDEKTAKIDQIITTINIQIDKLKELRKTLINDVVTGKIKVFDENKDKLTTDPVDYAKWKLGLDENVSIEANAS